MQRFSRNSTNRLNFVRTEIWPIRLPMRYVTVTMKEADQITTKLIYLLALQEMRDVKAFIMRNLA